MTDPQDVSGAAPDSQWSMPRGLIVILGLAALVVTVAGIQVAASIVGPIFLALMLTVAVHPLPEWLHRKGLPTWLATIAAILVVNSIILVLVISAIGLMTGATWARVVAVCIAALSILANFLWLPYYPLWSILIIALDVVVIWAVTTWDTARD